ncbi:outer membrane beta-barrel protein [Terrimonas pollutisoli]|uniref:outer membrane beta-barrel protein n=1 Tax=Terrimonas pollutisoli TaxID=3034147 RepID=UPI0023ED8DAF|nr:outer membrane beta-barrel protein [Terrimonas sp. H1YJ31]
MNKDLHDIDDLFRSELEENEETPSASLKESLFAHLDKKDAEYYKKRFIGWKRAAILLSFLLAGFVLYESGIVRTGSGHSTKKIITKKNDAATPAKETINARDAGNQNTDKSIPGDEELSTKEKTTNKTIADDAKKYAQPKQKENSDHDIDPVTIEKKQQDNKLAVQKNKQFTRQIKSLAGNKETIPDPSKSDIIVNAATIRSRENLTKEKRNFAPLVEAIKLIKIDARSFAGTQDPIASGFKIPASIDSVLKNDAAKNISSKRIHHFKPFWTLTGLATYDRVNYKLDSDQPNAITSIQHREVHEPSFSVGILATRQLKERWGVQTGLIYSNTAIGISPQKIYALQDPAGDIAYKYITSSGYAYIKPGFGSPPAFGDSLTTTEATHSLHSISVPLVIKYTVGKNRFLFLPGAGLEANFITRAKLETEIEDAANRETVFINKLNGTKSFYWSLMADAELRYNVNNKLSFSLRPVFRYAISPITENNVVETFPYSFGASLGITYKFQ